MAWQVQAAKQRFGELIDRTLSEGPQTVTRRGRPVAVVVEVEQFRRLSPVRRTSGATWSRARISRTWTSIARRTGAGR